MLTISFGLKVWPGVDVWGQVLEMGFAKLHLGKDLAHPHQPLPPLHPTTMCTMACHPRFINSMLTCCCYREVTWAPFTVTWKLFPRHGSNQTLHVTKMISMSTTITVLNHINSVTEVHNFNWAACNELSIHPSPSCNPQSWWVAKITLEVGMTLMLKVSIKAVIC